MQETVSKEEKETLKLAKSFANRLPSQKNVICLFGDLGSGKTVFVKGIAEAFNINNYSVKSPTYTFIREHTHNKGKLIHIDLYRLEGSDDLLLEQIEEFCEDRNNLVVIEWADRMKDNLPDERIDVCFEHIDKNTRKIIIF